MDTLQKMRVFTHVVETGSFTAAAQHLQMTTTRISRAVSDLEANLRTRLLDRTTRRIALTEPGERYLQRCEQILEHVEEAEAEARDANARPRGKLRVHAMTSIGVHYVVPAISLYQQRCPDVSIDLTLAQRIPDLLDEDYDVSVVLGNRLPDPRFVSQRLGRAFSIVCASPAYLEKHGVPKTPSDLVDHVCLRMLTAASSMDQWSFDGPRGIEIVALPSASFQVNRADAMASAVSEGMGIGVLPVRTVANRLKSGDIVRVMPDYTSQPINAYALYSPQRHLEAKIRMWVQALRDHVIESLAAEQATLRELTAV